MICLWVYHLNVSGGGGLSLITLISCRWVDLSLTDRGRPFTSLGTLRLLVLYAGGGRGFEEQSQVVVFFKHLQVFILLSRCEQSSLEIDVMIIQSALVNES